MDVEATLVAGGTGKLKKGAVTNAWRKSLSLAGQSGTLAPIEGDEEDDDFDAEGESSGGRDREQRIESCCMNEDVEETANLQYAPRNKVIRNRGDPAAVRQAKIAAKEGKSSTAIRQWLFPPSRPRTKGLAKNSLSRFSDQKPPVVLNGETIRMAVDHLSKVDPKLGAVIDRVGAAALISDFGHSENPTDAGLFNYCLRSITFSMISVAAGNSFIRRFAMKIGAHLEQMEPKARAGILRETVATWKEAKSESYATLNEEKVLTMFLEGNTRVTFTPQLVGELAKECVVLKGKRSGFPHLCGKTHPCGMHDDHSEFLAKARSHAKGGDDHVSTGYSIMKAEFIIALVDDFQRGNVTAAKIAAASDREAAKMLLGIKGIGDWCAGSVLVHFLRRADIMMYGDVTIRNYLNDMYEIHHNETSETMLESLADFPDNGENRNRMDALAKERGWHPYCTVVGLLMYHLEEENLVLL